mmetsp:Transcript_31865/g.90936  ORF Transcript_31865/g.90936 Transcript_31865/m.90936 type:complete len:276 (+) Transcript_31865:2803-3630(+)
MRRDAVREAADADVRRPHGHRQQQRLLLGVGRLLRREPLQEELEGSGPGVGEVALRGHRGVRLGHDGELAAAAGEARRRRADDLGLAVVGAGGLHRAPLLVGQVVEGAGRGREVQRAAVRHPLPRRGGGEHAPGPRGLAKPQARQRHARAALPLDHRRGRLGLRHRLRRPRPRPRLGGERERARPRHRGLQQHRRAGLEGLPQGRLHQDVRRRQGGQEEGPRRHRHDARERLCGLGLHGRGPCADRQGLPGGRGLQGPVADRRLRHVRGLGPPLG